ncbi:MAG: flagellin [Thermoprotei archaeon]|nr:flagellin [Thermoprotei archaeon]
MMWKKTRKGIVGIEAAIVLIAFVIVAAALAFVVLNMGFTTTQKSGAVIQSGLGEASTALEVDGSVLAYSSAGSTIDYIVTPIKASPGKHYVDMDPERASILYWSTEAGSFADIYTVYGYVYWNSTGNAYYLNATYEGGSSITAAYVGTSINMTKIWEILKTNISEGLFAAVIWVDYNSPFNTNLEIGEKAIVMIIFKDASVKPEAYQTIKLEIKPPSGAPLTVERTMPPGIDQGVIDLG